MELKEVDSTLKQFMYFPNEHAATVTSLWIAHTHLRGQDGSFLPQRTGRLYFGSKEAGAGKTLALDLTTTLSHNGETHVNPTQFALVSSINLGLGTNGIDEIDRFFGTRGSSKADVQTVILAGYRRGAVVTRQRNDELERQNVHGPLVMAGKNLNRFLTSEAFETLRTRSFIVALERKPKSTDVDKYQSEIHEPRLIQLSNRLKRWGLRHGPSIVSLDVQDTMDRLTLDNRDEEIWSILFRIAHYVGGEWPRRIELAARAMVLGEFDDDETPIQTPAEELLTWVKAIFADDEEFLPSRIILTRIMAETDNSAWFRREWRNPRAASMGLARTLGDVYGIHAERATYEGTQERGYYRIPDSIDDSEDSPIDISQWDWSEID